MGVFTAFSWWGLANGREKTPNYSRNWKHEGVFGSDLVCIFVVVTNKYDLCKWNHSQYNPLSLSLSLWVFNVILVTRKSSLQRREMGFDDSR